MCFTVGNDAVSSLFKTNINRPPKGVNPKEWINVLCDLLTESFSASFGVHKILLETLDEAFQGWGVYEGSEHYPNWFHIKKMLENKSKEAKGRETGWYESAMRVATVLTFGGFGKVVNYEGKRSISIEELFDKKTIFELNSLSNIEKKFFSEYILTYIYKLKKAKQNTIDDGFNFAILVDEAHNIFLKKETSFMTESVTDMVYREMREYGTSLICLDQHISKLSDTVTGNSACHVAFQQQLPQDLHNISLLMQLPDRKEIFSQLNVGSAIVKLSDRHTQPFLVQAPFVDLRKSIVDDEEIARRMQFLVEGHNVSKEDPEFLEEITYSQKEETKVIPEEIRVIEIPKFEERVSSNKYIAFSSNVEKQKMPEVNFSSGFNETQAILFNFAKKSLQEGMSISQIEKILEKGLHENCYSDLDVFKVMTKTLDLKLTNNSPSRKIERKNRVLEIELPEIIHIEEKPSFVFEEETKEEKTLGIKTDKIVGKEIIVPEVKVLEANSVEIIVEEKQKEKSEEKISLEKPKTIEIGSKILTINNEYPVGLTLEERKFFKFLKENPEHEKSVTEIYSIVGLSARKGNVIKNSLLKKDLIRVEEFKNEKGWKKFIRLN